MPVLTYGAAGAFLCCMNRPAAGVVKETGQQQKRCKGCAGQCLPHTSHPMSSSSGVIGSQTGPLGRGGWGVPTGHTPDDPSKCVFAGVLYRGGKERHIKAIQP